MTRIEPTPSLDDLGSPGAHLLDEYELRARVARWLASHEGLRSSGRTEPLYETQIFPVDRPEWRHRAADEMYSCALRFRAALYHLGVPHPLITCPYETRVGLAVADVATAARHYGALVEGSQLATYEPREGDALCSMGGAGPHVSCVVGAEWSPSPSRLVLTCVDGGQGGRGDMAIESNIYVWSHGAIASVEPPRSLDRPGASRHLIWCVDLWALVLNAGLLGPDASDLTG